MLKLVNHYSALLSQSGKWYLQFSNVVNKFTLCKEEITLVKDSKTQLQQ